MSTSPERKARVLLVEDEAHLAQGLLFNLQAEGYDVQLARDGERALSLLLPPKRDYPERASANGLHDRVEPLPEAGYLAGQAPAADLETSDQLERGASDFDAVLLDVMLPGKSGFDVVRELRDASIYIPVLMLTARGRPEDVLLGLDAGADDYLPKPFDLSILLARLHVMLRRTRWHRTGSEAVLDGPPSNEAGQPPTYSFAGRMIDFSMLELTAKGAAIRLTLMEAEFLRYLSLNPFRIIPRKELLEQVWRVHEDTDTRAIDNFVVRLRRYLEDEPANPVYLKTVRGVGYRFLPNGE